MRRLAASILVLAALVCAPATARAELLSVAAVTDLSAQPRTQRAPTRVTVTPARRLVRECDFRLVREVRATGVYVVPRERCWWARR